MSLKERELCHPQVKSWTTIMNFCKDLWYNYLYHNSSLKTWNGGINSEKNSEKLTLTIQRHYTILEDNDEI